MENHKEIDFSEIENLISTRLSEIASKRAALQAEIDRLDQLQSTFRENVRSLLSGNSRRNPEASSPDLSTKKRPKRHTLLNAAIAVLKERKTFMSRREIADAIKTHFPDEFPEVNVGSLYPFLREVARLPEFKLDATKKCLLYTGGNTGHPGAAPLPDPFDEQSDHEVTRYAQAV